MIALSEATGWVMVAGWATVLLGWSALRDDQLEATTSRALGFSALGLGLALAVVARVVV